jgi:hypothetical protein
MSVVPKEEGKKEREATRMLEEVILKVIRGR